MKRTTPGVRHGLTPAKATSTSRRCGGRGSATHVGGARATLLDRDAAALPAPVAVDALLRRARRSRGHLARPTPTAAASWTSTATTSTRSATGIRASSTRSSASSTRCRSRRAASPTSRRVELAERLARARARPARQGAARARRHARDRHGAQARARRHRPPQDDLDVGQRSTAPRSTRSRSAAKRCSASDIGPLLPGTEHVPPCDPRDCRFGCGGSCNARCADYVDYVLDKEQDVAAVIVETVRCTDVQIPPPAYYRRPARRLRPPRRAADPRRGADRRSAAPARCSRSSTTASFPTWSCSARGSAARCSRWPR